MIPPRYALSSTQGRARGVLAVESRMTISLSYSCVLVSDFFVFFLVVVYLLVFVFYLQLLHTYLNYYNYY